MCTHPADFAVVSLGRLLLEVLPLLELLGVGEGHAVDALQGLGVRLTLPVGGRVLQQADSGTAGQSGGGKRQNE